MLSSSAELFKASALAGLRFDAKHVMTETQDYIHLISSSLKL